MVCERSELSGEPPSFQEGFEVADVQISGRQQLSDPADDEQRDARIGDDEHAKISGVVEQSSEDIHEPRRLRGLSERREEAPRAAKAAIPETGTAAASAASSAQLAASPSLPTLSETDAIIDSAAEIKPRPKARNGELTPVLLPQTAMATRSRLAGRAPAEGAACVAR